MYELGKSVHNCEDSGHALRVWQAGHKVQSHVGPGLTGDRERLEEPPQSLIIGLTLGALWTGGDKVQHISSYLGLPEPTLKECQGAGAPGAAGER